MKTVRTIISLITAFVPQIAFGACSTGGTGIKNPLSFCTLSEFLSALLDTIIMFSVPIVVLAVIYSGFLFVTAGENATKISNAKKILFWTLMGALIILGAKVIASVVQGTVGQLTSP